MSRVLLMILAQRSRMLTFLLFLLKVAHPWAPAPCYQPNSETGDIPAPALPTRNVDGN